MKHIFGKDLSKQIFKEIWTYYEFHHDINKYFVEGINLEPNNYEQEVYFVDYNWIKSWKKYTNYENVITMEKNYEFLKENGFLEYNEKTKLRNLESGNAKFHFLNISVYKIEDFDCLIDKATYDLFKRYDKKTLKMAKILDSNLESINIIFFEEIFAILIEKQHRIKIIYQHQVESSLELVQLNLDFKAKNNNVADDGIKDIFNLIFFHKLNDNINYYWDFKENCLKKKAKRGEIIKILSDKVKSGKETFYIKMHEYKVTNPILHANNISNIILDKNLELSLNNVNSKRLIGLQNIGATCYMNATLQCMANLKQFTNYLLTKDNFFIIINKMKDCELLCSYCELLHKLCCDENVIDYYAPNKFKEILSLKNPLFEGIQANDSKDLIYFLLEEMNFELNHINLKINPNILKVSNDFQIIDINQENRQLVLQNFIEEYTSNNNNIIPKLFFTLVENESICKGCNRKKYNYQIVFSLELPLEVIYNKIYGQQNQNRKLNLLECINNYNESTSFTGENAIYCDICQKQIDSIYNKIIYSLSPIIIIILNRGKGNQFKCDVDFPEEIDFKPYIINSDINYSYKLVGVVTHFGTNDMGGHFIAYCRHRILNEWYCYNDATVTKLTDQKNGYKNGVPYILFYESMQGNNNMLFHYFQINKLSKMAINNNINNINIANINNTKINNNNLNQNFNFNNNINNNINYNMNNNFNYNMNNNMNSNINNNINYNMNNYMNNNINNNINYNMNNNINYNMNNNMNNNINNNLNNLNPISFNNNINNNYINNNNMNNMQNNINYMPNTMIQNNNNINLFNNNFQSFNNMNINTMPNQQLNINTQ